MSELSTSPHRNQETIFSALAYMFSTHYTKKKRNFKDLLRILGPSINEEMLDSFFQSSQPFQRNGDGLINQPSTDYFPQNKTLYIKPTSDTIIDIEIIKNELKEITVVRCFQTKSGFLIEVNDNSIAKRLLGKQFKQFSIGKPYSTTKKKLISNNKKKLAKFEFFYETSITKESPTNDLDVIKVIHKNRCLLASKKNLSSLTPVPDEKKKKIIEVMAINSKTAKKKNAQFFRK